MIAVVYTDDYFDLIYDKNIIDYKGCGKSARVYTHFEMKKS